MYTFAHKKQKCSFLKLKRKTDGELSPKKRTEYGFLFSQKVVKYSGNDIMKHFFEWEPFISIVFTFLFPIVF